MTLMHEIGAMTSRRRFLRLTGSAALAAALAHKAPSARADAAGVWRNRNPDMAYRRLGRTGYMISEVICGGNTISPVNFEHVNAAIDMGLNYLDTAPAYGSGASEQGYSKVLKDKRDQVFLATKVSLWASNRNELFQKIFESLPASEQRKLKNDAREELEKRHALDENYLLNYFAGQRPALEASALSNVMERRFGDRVDRRKEYKSTIIRSVEESLQRLGTDHVDLLNCPHGANSYEEVTRFPEIFEAFETLKTAGKVAHLGVSSHSDPAGVLQGAIDAKVYSMGMVAFNILNRPYVEPALEKAQQADLGVIAMKVARPIHHGRNNGQPNDPRRVAVIEEAIPGKLKTPLKCYLWALRNSKIAAVNSEMKNIAMVRDNLPLAGRVKA